MRSVGPYALLIRSLLVWHLLVTVRHVPGNRYRPIGNSWYFHPF